MDAGAPGWFVWLQSAGIIGSLLLAAYATLRDVRTRKVTNYLQLIAYHRDVWRMTMELDGLSRIRQSEVSASDAPITDKESQFLSFLFLHITCSYELRRSNSLAVIEKLEYDIADLMKFPLVRQFWVKNQRFYNSDFVEFVDWCVDSQRRLEDGARPFGK